MADSQSKIDAAAEKAYAEAAQKKGGDAAPKAVEKAVAADAAPTVKAADVAKPAAAQPKPAKKKAATRKAPTRKAAARNASAPKSARKPVVARKLTKTTKPVADGSTIAQLKEKIMATANTTDFTARVKETAAEAQTRAKAAYDKGSEITSDVVEFQKGNLEALVESGKVLAGGVQEMGRVYLEDAKLAAETVTADVKRMVAVKSPTELFQLQGELMRRNFDAAMARASRNVEMATKLANDAFAPISTRASVAAERMSKAA